MSIKTVLPILASLLLASLVLGQPRDELVTNSNPSTSIQPPLPPPLPRIAQVPRDEFNSTESSSSIELNINYGADHAKSKTDQYLRQISALRHTLLELELGQCCPPWQNLTNLIFTEVHEEPAAKRKHAKGSLRDATTLTASDMMHELKRVSLNITFLSIDGQPGDNERDKYYNFYDAVQYYLRLLKLANQTMLDEHRTKSRELNKTFVDELDRLNFKRNLNSVEFRTGKDPILSAFLHEFTEESAKTNSSNRFALYEDFILYTDFGQHYAHNVSLIRESVVVFDQVYSHLLQLDFQSNFTRPSRLYEMIRRMSYELYLIKTELLDSISIRVRSNREDVRRTLAKLDDLVERRPYVRMLGDEFTLQPPYFSEHVRHLTHLLDLYLTNSLTQLTFYDQLSELPQDFIILGSSIAHEYETKEIPQYTRYDSSHFNSLNVFGALNGFQVRNQEKANSSNSNQEQVDGRQSNLSFMTRLFN